MMRVLVTGGTGFIGGATVDALRGRVELHATSRQIPSSSQDVVWHTVDLLDQNAVRELARRVRPTHIVHLAWNAEPGRFWTAKDNLAWVSSTLTLYREFAECGGQRFVGAGTCAEYDWKFEHHIEAVTPVNPGTLYGLAKANTCSLLECAAALDKISFAWGRIFFVYGPGEKRRRLVSDVAYDLITGNRPQCSDGIQHRDFMHVADYGRAFAKLLLSEVTGPVNIASGENQTIRAVVELLAGLAGCPDAPQFGVRPSAPNDPLHMSADIARLRDEVGFTPQFTLERGIADTLAWWRERLRADI